ncbi:efflux RND transporter periplasmic adaptor subunit [Ponticaulis profundi]|uniref:efflux RND transporter periplasmic adaptor subunit n=1 Tax=Ponticaulis profundi TaxID=2665222 RepID=UPI00366A767D
MAKRRKKFPLVASIVVLAIAAGGTWYVFGRGSQNVETQYQTAAVSRSDLQTTISAAGKIRPKETLTVGAQVSGQLEELFVEVGDIVEEGQLLAQIDASIATTSVEAQQAQLKELRASRQQHVANLQLAKSQALRAEKLYAADAIAQAELETAEAALAVAEAQLISIDAQIERQTSSLKADMTELEFTKIYAPVKGTVTTLEAIEGQTLNANQTAPTILTIADLTEMTVETDVSEADVLNVYQGQPAYFTTLGNSDETWTTQVRQILPEPEVVNDVVLYKALLDIANPDGRLRTEMTTQVFFITGKTENAIIIPATALQGARPRRAPSGDAPAPRSEPSGDMARLREENPKATTDTVLIMGADGTPQPRPVLVGLKTRNDAEILYGLREGEQIVTNQVASAAIASGRPPGPPPRGFRG